ncbi:MAG: metal-dependent transcriptional regulator [Clostridiales bacterium]|nr:metal-dependent transcriptional regulator [Clostridiales bacterium]MDO4349569.1 metal-dependent transcriptional regulator [Eubacteriales bacterium]MDY4007280.1 metal-dependent transcriptional regulator [Candidatus Limiplasma sp.]
MNIHESAEDYLEAILMLCQENGSARSVDIAARLNVTKPSVSFAMKRLRENGYILMGDDNRITLTERGEAIAKPILERHNLLSSFLIRLGVSEEVALADACKIEHDLSDETFAAIRRHVEKYS